MNPFQPLVAHWFNKIRLAADFKRREFQDNADECYRFFDSTYEFLYGLKYQRGGFAWSGKESDLPKPSFCMTLNKVAEFVEIFGPTLYHKNPNRFITPRKVADVPLDQLMPPTQDPMMQQQAMMQSMMLQQQVLQEQRSDAARAAILSRYLNYTPDALDLKRESRWSIDEALIKGMGLLWTETYQPAGGGGKMVGSFFGTVDNLVLDPDATILRDCKWCACRHIAPRWQIEAEYGIPPGILRGNYESNDIAAAIERSPEMQLLRAQGRTNDLLVYWKVYSKMGMGAKMAGVAPSLRQQFDGFGDYCYLVITEGADFPLNLTDQVLATGDMQQIMTRAGWPTPFWADDRWPFTPITFHDRPGKLWPMSHIFPALGELKFLNWAYSFVASKIKTTARDFIAIRKSAAEEIKSTILHGSDLELLEIDADHGTIKEVVEFLQHPNFNGDIWKVIEAVETNFEKRVGLTELIYGETGSQLRSASEANIKSNQLQVRPDDMATKVEESMSDLARAEAFCCRWHLNGQDVIDVLGPIGAQVWDMFVTASDPATILHSLEYRIEAGSTKKPNKETLRNNMNSAIQTLFTPLWQYASATMDFKPVNALISKWAEANEFDATDFLVQPPPPPMPGPGQQQPPQPGQGPPGPPQAPPQPGGQRR